MVAIGTAKLPVEHHICSITTWNPWDPTTRLLTIPTGSRGTVGVIWFKSEMRCAASLNLGFDLMFNPVRKFDGPLWTAGCERPTGPEFDQRTFKIDEDGLGLDWWPREWHIE